jgi:hypothetical protein
MNAVVNQGGNQALANILFETGDINKPMLVDDEEEDDEQMHEQQQLQPFQETPQYQQCCLISHVQHEPWLITMLITYSMAMN